MALFTYTAKDTLGNSRTGTVDARDKEIALNLLKAQGLYVVDINEKRDNILDQVMNFRGVPKGEVVTFTRQFATMISAGLPISRGLEVLSNQVSNKTFKKVIYDVLRSVEGGASVSTAMGKYPSVFSETYQSLVAAGESSGRLDEILNRLATTMEEERELNSKFKTAMIYPAVVFVAMIGVFIILMVFVVPKLAAMYESMEVDLPMITQLMIDVSNFMVDNLIIMLILAIGGVIGLRNFLKTDSGKRFFTKIIFSLPIFGPINKDKEVATFSRTLSLLISSAIPIVQALETTSRVVANNDFKRSISDAARQVQKGNSLSDFFKSDINFPPLLGQMAGVGEETGKMDEVLERVATYYSGEVDHKVKGLSSALEPVILIMLGAMVGFLIISIITPIYKLTSSF